MCQWNTLSPLNVILKEDTSYLIDPLAHELFHNIFTSVDKQPMIHAIIHHIFFHVDTEDREMVSRTITTLTTLRSNGNESTYQNDAPDISILLHPTLR